ncbi:MAG: hypothetical protein ACTS73_01265 [Arsenophonus sp. NEOnobi-MAG3]
MLVIIGITEHGLNELVAVEDAYRASESNWVNFSIPCKRPLT